MNELMSLAIKAHGGLDRWNTVTSVQAATSITGAIWYLKGKPDVLKNVIATAETRAERVTMTFVGQDNGRRRPGRGASTSRCEEGRPTTPTQPGWRRSPSWC